MELTSRREDGSYTWRAAGAKQPKGDLDGALLYEGAAVGDVVRVDAEFAVDGVYITGVLAPKAKRSEPQTLELLGSGRDEGGVTTQLVGKGDRGRGRSRDKGRGSDNRGGKGRGRSRDGGRGRSRDGEGGGSRDGGRSRDGDRNKSHDNKRSSRGGSRDRGGRRDGRSNSSRAEQSSVPTKPRPKRLRSRRTHRDAVLKDLPEIQRPLAQLVVRDGIAGLRGVIQEQNVRAKAADQVEIPPKVLEAVGENLLPRLRSAEWRDNAEAALAGIDTVDVRDIRKVIVAAENGARDEESRALAEQLKEGLMTRVENEHRVWLSEIETLLKEGRVVRALRQSSRPPKAGAPLPAELASRLSAATAASMTADTSSDRWGTVLDALAFSPVRQHVTPQALPQKVSDELRSTVKKLSKRVPEIAALFKADAPAKPAAAAAPIPAPPTPAPAPAASDAPIPAPPTPAPTTPTTPS